MAKFTAIPLQTVPENQSVRFIDVIGCSRGHVLHSVSPELFTLRGITNQRFARYRVSFGGNIAIPADGTVEPISIALAVEGVPLGSATAVFTPAAVEEFGNVFVADIIDVPCGCCLSVSVRNTSTQAIDVENGNLIIERIA